MRVLTWNLFHGRARPGAARRPRGSLLADYAATLAGWTWDVALLQEVPPWWPPALAVTAGAGQRTVLTSRNAGLAVRRRIADRRPDWIKSNGGGANAILVRGTLCGHARRRLAVWPERRVLHAVRLGDGLLVANLHLTVHRPAQAAREARAAHAAAARWSAGAPFVLGGDFNLGRDLRLPGLRRVALNGPDHVWAAGLEPAGRAEVLDRRDLSDHAPVVVALRRSG